jgi:hypothetical protein
MTHKRLISAFKQPAPDIDSMSTAESSPNGASASASHGNSAQTSERLETLARLLTALSEILVVYLDIGRICTANEGRATYGALRELLKELSR